MPKEKLLTKELKPAFTLVEIILSLAIFMMVVLALSGALVYSIQVQGEANKQNKANYLLEEALEASNNIKDAGFANLTNGAHGLAISGGVWTFSGTSDVTDGYTRAVTISTVDANTQMLVATVSWLRANGTTETISATSELTNWKRTVVTSLPADGYIIYGDGTTTPKFRTYTTSTNVFGAQTATLVATSGVSFVMRTSPTKAEAIAGYVTAAGVLNVLCFDGTTWTNDWNVTVGGTGTTRRFDIAYSTNTGDVMVLYSRNVPTTNELGYRTKSGSAACGSANWGSATNLDPVRTSGTVQWVKMAWDKRASSNLITAIWADSNSDLSAMVWSGSAWGNEPAAATETSLAVVAAAQDVEDFNVQYASVSGDVMLVWANSAGARNVNGVRYRTCTGGTATCTWNAVTTPPTFADGALSLDLSANPNTNEMVFASIGNGGGNRLQIGYWNGTTWTDTASVDTSCAAVAAGNKIVATGWLISGATTRSVIVYNDSAATNIGWYVGNAGVFTLQGDFAAAPAFANPQRWYNVEMNPLSADQMMFSLSDNTNNLYSKRLVMTSVPAFTWTNSDGAALVTTLPQTISSPFSFAYKRH